jgi:hypothetical protein
MTYAGRQVVESAVKQAASLSKTALVRASERRKDTPSADNIVVCGPLGYAGTWKRSRSGSFPFLTTMLACCLCLGVFSLLLWNAISGLVDLSALIRPPQPNELVAAIAASLIFTAGSIAAGFFAGRQLMLGFDDDQARHYFGGAARKMWGIGDKALYIVSDELSDGRPKTATVFYDAVGTVDLEQNDDGVDVVTLRSRDGSVISEFVDPVTSATTNAKVIVDAISERIAAAK